MPARTPETPGAIGQSSTPDEFATFPAGDLDRWRRVIELARITADEN